MNERSLSARWRKSDVVSVLGAATWPGESHEPSLLRWLHGSLESWLLAMLILENRTGRSGPAKESRLTRSFPSPSAACEPCIDLLPLCTEPRFSSRSNMASLIIRSFSPKGANTRSGLHERRAPKPRQQQVLLGNVNHTTLHRLTIGILGFLTEQQKKGEDTEWAKSFPRSNFF